MQANKLGFLSGEILLQRGSMTVDYVPNCNVSVKNGRILRWCSTFTFPVGHSDCPLHKSWPNTFNSYLHTQTTDSFYRNILVDYWKKRQQTNKKQSSTMYSSILHTQFWNAIHNCFKWLSYPLCSRSTSSLYNNPSFMLMLSVVLFQREHHSIVNHDDAQCWAFCKRT